MEPRDDLEPEVQTDKVDTKEVPCLGCGRRLVVNRFYAPAKARCSACRDGSGATVTSAPVAGKTDPTRVADLTRVLVNPHFARALCPVHPDDEAHVMELKSVAHSPQYGPSPKVPGETVLLQCLKCKATVAYSTTAQMQFQRQNEAQEHSHKHVNGWAEILGVRD